MGLDKYHKKRDFKKTPEPKGKEGPRRTQGNTFVVHMHDATRLHYDLRLEMDGVFRSWAVPKGPTMNPAQKHLAVYVEDHPLEYGDFEGVIPKGEYGGGTVLLWDRGTWAPKGDPNEGMEKGNLKFELLGEKLRGVFALVRLRMEGGLPDPKNWLLIKDRDEEAIEGSITELYPLSVQTGRSLAEVAEDADRVWTQTGEVPPESVAPEKPKKRREPTGDVPDCKKLKGVKKAELARTMKPQLATLSKDVPEGDKWIHEIKYDGYRALVFVSGGEIRVLTRNGHDWTDRFQSIATAAKDFPVDALLLDGEVAVLEPNGTTSFQALQNALREGSRVPLVYFAFDVMHLDGNDLRSVPLENRKTVLSALFAAAGVGDGVLRFSDHIEGSGEEVYRQASRFALEGIISKRRDGKYRSGRSTDWIKIKFTQREDFVIGGFTNPAVSRSGFGALLVGTFDGGGRLIYTGRVGTGFTEHLLTSLRSRMDELERKTPPFSNPPKGSAVRAMHWIDPLLVAQVEFTGWTQDEHLRHPSFQGLREDISPREVVGFPDRVSGEPVSEEDESAREEGSSFTEESSGSKPRSKRSQDGQPIQLMDGLRLTNPDRVFYSQRGITKIGLCTFYQEIEKWIIPQIVDRPLSLVRCPGGQGGETFYQKHANDSVPEVVGRIELEEKKGKQVVGLYVEHLASLVGLVQIGVLEVHVWGCKIDKVERPDRMILDLDPDVALPWYRVIEGAKLVREKLLDLGLESFLKTTGGKGLHVVVPISRRHTWAEMMQFSQAVSDSLAKDSPGRFTTIQSLARRKGRIYLDFRRNTRGATAIAAYSTRAHPQATVSVPLGWEELDACLGSDYYHVANLPRRLKGLTEDPWEGMEDVRQSLTAKAKKKLGM